MIKKISAVILALVLCLSVVVVPASALDLGSASVAFELKWDKEYYNAGETAYLQVFMKAEDALELGTGSILIGTNSAQITQDTTHVDAVGSDLWNSFWKEPAGSQGGWQNATIAGRVDTANNDTEKALYDQYLKIVIARNNGGSHDNAANTRQGLPGADINALADAGEPIITFAFVVGDVADGTKLNAAITTGSLTCSPAQTAFKYIKSPGSATTTANVAAADFDVSAAVAEATVGEPAPTTYTATYYSFDGTQIGDVQTVNVGEEPVAPTAPLRVGYAFANWSLVTDADGNRTYTATYTIISLGVKYWKDQIRFQADKEGKYADKFDYRILATIDNFTGIFADAADAVNEADGDYILEAGFIFSKTEKVDKDKALTQINGGTVSYSAVTNAYISTSFDGKEYVMACYVGNIADADVDTSLSALGYVKYVVNGETRVDTFDAAQTSTFRTLYDKNASNKPA